MRRQTHMAKRETTSHDWHLVDADGRILGRMATSIARVLMGKHKPEYTPHVDTGDYVIVTNAEKVRVTGRKKEQRLKTRYTGYSGGLKVRTLGEEMAAHPERVIEEAVRRMLPKGPLGRDMYRKLKVYRGTDHPHHAQQPRPLEISA